MESQHYSTTFTETCDDGEQDVRHQRLVNSQQPVGGEGRGGEGGEGSGVGEGEGGFDSELLEQHSRQNPDRQGGDGEEIGGGGGGWERQTGSIRGGGGELGEGRGGQMLGGMVEGGGVRGEDEGGGGVIEVETEWWGIRRKRTEDARVSS